MRLLCSVQLVLYFLVSQKNLTKSLGSTQHLTEKVIKEIIIAEDATLTEHIALKLKDSVSSRGNNAISLIRQRQHGI